jgi:hypothetical protein
MMPGQEFPTQDRGVHASGQQGSYHDLLVIGAGIYGLYAATRFARQHPLKRVAIVEIDSQIFARASWINQARVHNGYHYPRSLSTALKSAGYFKRFYNDFKFAINDQLQKVYAVSANHSYTDARNFIRFCQAANIPCQSIHPGAYFKDNTVGGCFLTEEYAFDAQLIKHYFLEQLESLPNIQLYLNTRIEQVTCQPHTYYLQATNQQYFETPMVLNASYASINQVSHVFRQTVLNLKYELAELSLCRVIDGLGNVGLTIMDGPFFSLMPFNQQGEFSLSAVHYTPHKTALGPLPQFECQQENPLCSPLQLQNCNTCLAQPQNQWATMRQLSQKYLKEEIKLEYTRSLFAIKPLLMTSEMDDSRPTLINIHNSAEKSPQFMTVLSGKINTLYDLDAVI